MGEWFSESGTGQGSSITEVSSWDPITPIASTGTLLWEKIAQGAVSVKDFVSSSYQWVKTAENQKSLISFLKSFWDYSIWEQMIIEPFLTLKEWVEILFSVELLGKATITFSNIWTFTFRNNKSWDSLEQNIKNMISWLYAGIFIKPQGMIGLFGKEIISQEQLQEEDLPEEEDGSSNTCESQGQRFIWITQFQNFLKGGGKDSEQGKCLKEVFELLLETTNGRSK